MFAKTIRAIGLVGSTFVMVILIGCTSPTAPLPNPTDSIDSTSQVTLTATPSEVTSTVFPSLTLATTLELTATPTLVLATPLPTFTSRPEPTATPTPLPTIPPEELETFVLELIQGNPECQLPCWWGAIPGETVWREVQPFLATFAEITSRSIGNAISYSVNIYIPDKVAPSIVYGGAYIVRDDVIRSIQTAGSTPNYFLSQLLNDYGQPEEVWLNTYNNTPGGTIPFRLTLVYQEGFVVTYSLENATKHPELIVGCFDYIAPFLWLVSPNRGITFEEAHQESAQVGIDQFYLPLQEATDLTLLEFYEQFKNPENPACLETSTNLWP